MDQEPGNTSSDQDEIVFPSKKDGWIAGLLWLIVAVSAAGAAAAFVMSLPILSLMIQEVIWIGMIAFCVSILRSTNYTIRTDSLLVRTGPFRWTILFEDIKEVVPTRKIWSSASLSMDRLYVNHSGSAGGTYISPENKQYFLEALAGKASNLELAGDRLISIDAVDSNSGS